MVLALLRVEGLGIAAVLLVLGMDMVLAGAEAMGAVWAMAEDLEPGALLPTQTRGVLFPMLHYHPRHRDKLLRMSRESSRQD